MFVIFFCFVVIVLFLFNLFLFGVVIHWENPHILLFTKRFVHMWQFGFFRCSLKTSTITFHPHSTSVRFAFCFISLCLLCHIRVFESSHVHSSNYSHTFHNWLQYCGFFFRFNILINQSTQWISNKYPLNTMFAVATILLPYILDSSVQQCVLICVIHMNFLFDRSFFRDEPKRLQSDRKKSRKNPRISFNF